MKIAEDYLCNWIDLKYKGSKDLGEWTPEDVVEFANDLSNKNIIDFCDWLNNKSYAFIPNTMIAEFKINAQETMEQCLNKYCHNEVTDSVFCGKCTPPYEDFNKIVSEIESTNEKLFDEIEWCKQHNMNWEAGLKEQLYSHTRRIITKLKHDFLP